MTFDRVAFLRGVNVGGHRQVTMSALRDLFSACGVSDAQTFLQSGNVVFKGGRGADSAIERRLELETVRQLKIETSYFVRSAAELAEIVKRNPFKPEARDDPGRLLVYFLKESPNAKAAVSAGAAIVGPERMQVSGREAYVYYPDGVGRSKFKLAWLGTGRNWNTVRRLLALMTDAG